MYHLAQLNIARLLKPIDHPQIKEFVDNLDRINELAEQSYGFVWRLKDETGNATGISVFNDPLIIVNMSVWESIPHLKSFVYDSNHKEIMRKRRNWFEKPTEPHMVLWWVVAGHTPSPEEAKQMLLHLTRHGPTTRAFTFQRVFPPL